MTEIELLESVKEKRVLFLGEEIIDVYHYVAPLGRPTKDAIVSVLLGSTETFLGGLWAAAAHAMDFCHVDYEPRGYSTKKVRFVESSHVRKLFEYYETDYLPYENASNASIAQYDAAIVLDYGHGMTDDPAFIPSLAESKYLAVNVQTNSGNYGFNLCTKYPYADYLCVDESEARLATQNRSGSIEDSLLKLAEKAEKTVITLGKAGAIGYCESDGMVRMGACTDKVVDTMGAGDAFFAITAVVAERASLESILRIGNAAGAIKAGIVGHRGSVTKDELIKLLQLPEKAIDGNAQGRAHRRRVRAAP